MHRVQSFEDVQALVRSARELDYASVNVDLIYGLPLQTTESFARTIAQVIELRPDRIALYAYAHLPTRFKPQRRINEADLPDRATRVGLLGAAIEGFLTQGYTYIGMDHFALGYRIRWRSPSGAASCITFQGYSTQPDRDLIALGVSAIGRIGNTYSQNAEGAGRPTRPSNQALRRGARAGAERDDLARGAKSSWTSCARGRVDFARIEARHRLRFGDYFSRELLQMAHLAELGLVDLRPGGCK